MSGTILFANDALSWLTYEVLASDTQVSVPPGEGDRFPNPVDLEFFVGVLEDLRTGAKEYVRATARTGDTITIVRAQEDSTALDFPAGSTFSLRLTAAALEFILANSGGGGGGIPEAPTDGGTYGRRFGAWVALIAAYDLYFDFGSGGVPANAERAMVLTRDITIPANLVGSQVSVAAGDASAPVFTLLRAGVSIATLTLSAVGGTWAAVTPGVAIDLLAGQLIMLRAPGSVAPAFVGVRASVAAQRT